MSVQTPFETVTRYIDYKTGRITDEDVIVMRNLLIKESTNRLLNRLEGIRDQSRPMTKSEDKHEKFLQKEVFNNIL